MYAQGLLPLNAIYPPISRLSSPLSGAALVLSLPVNAHTTISVLPVFTHPEKCQPIINILTVTQANYLLLMLTDCSLFKGRETVPIPQAHPVHGASRSAR